MSVEKCNYCGNPIKPDDHYWVDVSNIPGGINVIVPAYKYYYIFCKQSCRDTVAKAFDKAIESVQKRFQLPDDEMDKQGG